MKNTDDFFLFITNNDINKTKYNEKEKRKKVYRQHQHEIFSRYQS